MLLVKNEIFSGVDFFPLLVANKLQVAETIKEC